MDTIPLGSEYHRAAFITGSLKEHVLRLQYSTAPSPPSIPLGTVGIENTKVSVFKCFEVKSDRLPQVEEVGANRRLPVPVAALAGLVSGAASYLAAESLTPQNVSFAGDHDLLLADRLGLIFAPVVGVYLGWIQRSWKRTAIGVGAGLVVGLVFVGMTSCRSFLAIMVGFPCILGGVFAALMGSNESKWGRDLAIRFWKGLVAGLGLGLIYTIVLNVVLVMFVPFHFHDQGEEWTRLYIAGMWRAGPVALGLGGALFFIQIRWAVGLNCRMGTINPEGSKDGTTG